MDLFALQTENYKKIITIALMISIAFSLVPLRRAKAIPVKEIFDYIFQILQTFWTKYLQQVWEQIKDYVLEAVKQATLGAFINQTLTWVAGGGKPQFITNWKGFVQNAANTVKNQMLTQIKNFANVCLAWKGAFNAALDLRYKMSPLKELQCPNSILNNPLFFQKFEIGGWPGYLNSYLPAADLHGAVNTGVQVIEGEAAAAAGAAQNEGVAGKGFASAKKCVQTAQGQKCDEIKTPGASIAGMTENIISSPKDLIANGGDKAVAIFSTLLFMALLQKLITKGLGA